METGKADSSAHTGSDPITLNKPQMSEEGGLWRGEFATWAWWHWDPTIPCTVECFAASLASTH